MTYLYEITPLYASGWAWTAWIVIGAVVGLLASNEMPVKRNRIWAVTISLAGAIAGGWGSAAAIGDHTPQSFALAALSSLFVAGVAEWIYTRLLRGRNME